MYAELAILNLWLDYLIFNTLLIVKPGRSLKSQASLSPVIIQLQSSIGLVIVQSQLGLRYIYMDSIFWIMQPALFCLLPNASLYMYSDQRFSSGVRIYFVFSLIISCINIEQFLISLRHLSHRLLHGYLISYIIHIFFVPPVFALEKCMFHVDYVFVSLFAYCIVHLNGYCANAYRNLNIKCLIQLQYSYTIFKVQLYSIHSLRVVIVYA